MNFPSKEIVQRLREIYPVGTRVELLQMDDPYTQIPPGTQGTVTWVDDAANVHIAWSNGSSLSAIYGVDRIRKI